MDDFAYKSSRIIVLYEFVGTALLSLTCNLGFRNVSQTLFIVTLWSWELSAAHFNICVTIA